MSPVQTNEPMTLQQELAGQQLLLGFDGTRLNRELKHIIRDIRAGGIILFKRNIQTLDQVTALCADCQAYAKSCGVPPLFVCVDQEGGVVARFKEPFTIFKGNPSIESVMAARNFAAVTAEELKQVGVNMNFAPVLDIAPPGQDSIMRDRVFKGDAKQVSLLGSQVISTLQDKGIMAVAKHFPGIGRTVKDSHFHLPVLDVDLEALNQSDIIPFAAAKNKGVAGIMLSHILYPQLDPNWQASLSPFIVNEVLRNQIGYEGLVMTDDLDMKAISHDVKTCIHQVLLSGIDLALICHKGPNIDIAWQEMRRLIDENNGIAPMQKKSIERILKTKKRYLAEWG